MVIAIAHTFVKSVSRLGTNDAQRVTLFLERLLEQTETFGTHPEIIREAPDRSVRSMRVSDDLRAVVRQTGEQLLALYVGHHNDAYQWARRHCYGCDERHAGRRVPVSAIPGHSASGLVGVGDSSAWYCELVSARDAYVAIETAIGHPTS